MRNIINNVYIKNIPKEWTQAQVHDLFSPFGHIKSCVLMEKENIGKFGFVCYADKDGKNKEYGPKCAN
jgi:RNA recognition motif-containing protein